VPHNDDASRHSRVRRPGLSRRRLIARGAGATAAGVGLIALTPGTAHAGTGAMFFGATNDAGVDETILQAARGGPALHVANTSTSGIGTYSFSDGIGVRASGKQAPLLLDPGSTQGPPAGTHEVGEVYVDSFGRTYHCVRKGPPSIWVRPGFNPILPVRYCDTRAGQGTPYSTGVKLGHQQTMTVSVAGVTIPGGSIPVPVGATAITGNLAVTQPTGNGFLTLFPANASRPVASTLNFSVNQTIANGYVIKLADAGGALAGAVKIYNSGGTSHVILDVTGFFF
jgi:hypothetical protein